jgi:hypothetical protein
MLRHESRVSAELLFDPIGVNVSRLCSLADENRIERHVEYICKWSPVLVRVLSDVKRSVTRGPVGTSLSFGNMQQASFPLELTRNRGTNTDGKDGLDVHEILQLMPVETMLFYHKIVPVNLSARKDNTRERIGR